MFVTYILILEFPISGIHAFTYAREINIQIYKNRVLKKIVYMGNYSRTLMF